ncbi:E3 ubiquitin protein ligase DRIP1 [Cardamine amara subsp. amara]|uniref:E3 ubiquitin protein ligase DRIP1 n=1 Tax=Cardamine amara subsp. amara TaxID=228776 RepID=A0ABD1APS3_CARAN
MHAERKKASNMDKRQDTTFSVPTQTPLWFRLVASNQEDTNEPLHQTSASYIKVKDSNLKVSYLKKYIVKKLDLKSEDEVELYLDNEPLDSLMTLYELLQYWIMKKPEGDLINTQAGSSGADCVMVINYGRKSQHVPQFTHLADTNEVAPIDNEAAKFTEVLSTSQYVSSPSGIILRSSQAFEFNAINGNNRWFGMLETS